MGWECLAPLYWHQEPGYSGLLNEKPEMDGKQGELVFELGKKYECLATPYRQGVLEYVIFCLVDEKGRKFPILRAELHHRASHKAFKYFSFRHVQKTIKDGLM